MTAGSEPFDFRLLSDRLLGYIWPRCVKSGERSEFSRPLCWRVRIGALALRGGQGIRPPHRPFDEHGPGATMQISPDGDYTQTGIEWNKHGYHSKALNQFIEAPERSGLYYLHARSKSGEFFSFPWVVAPAVTGSKIAVLASDITWNAYNSFGGRSNSTAKSSFSTITASSTTTRSSVSPSLSRMIAAASTRAAPTSESSQKQTCSASPLPFPAS